VVPRYPHTKTKNMYFPSIETLVATTAPQVSAFTSALWGPALWLAGISIAGFALYAVYHAMLDFGWFVFGGGEKPWFIRKEKSMREISEARSRKPVTDMERDDAFFNRQ